MRLLICVTFHYNRNRLKYLKKVLKGFVNIYKNSHIYIITNTFNQFELSNIKLAFPPHLINDIILIKSFKVRGHPHNLILCHKKFLFSEFIEKKKFTHFLHTEDDMLFNKKNFEYWTHYRQILKKYNNLPSFFRFEKTKENSEPKSTDVSFRILWFLIPKRIIKDYIFINMPNPSQSNYLIDKDLAEEMIKFPPNIKRHYFLNSNTGIRETTDYGPIFSIVPDLFISKNLVPILSTNYQIIPDCLIEHLPANYAKNNNTKMGKISLKKMIYYIPLPDSTLLRNIKYYVYVQIINVILKLFKNDKKIN
jgi:hypothetical protein